MSTDHRIGGPAEPSDGMRPDRDADAATGTLSVGRQYMRSVIAGLYLPEREMRADFAEREPEAGA